ncbi:restriction endonuclease subunit S [Pseudomonas sp. A-B-26]|uniref:restriction endonuclease subunit S n=1 Tax=Pseudomonas sp. A-B-26 TaxID=2832406 RepID=UPI001CBEE2DE|nr:restriction endonuclease subunit S [Pseudomonas sp. A-B-26]
MSVLKKVTLGECCTIVSGATPSTSVGDYWDGDTFWVTPKDLSNLDGHYISETPRKLTKAGLGSCSALVLPVNSVLFSSRAPIGLVAVNTVPMATNQGFKSFVPKKDIIDEKFLFHWLRANRVYLESLGNGATFKEVSKATVSKIEILLPSLPEQRRIAAILDQADTLRAKRREVLIKFDKLTQSIFVEMFSDAVTGTTNVPRVQLSEVTTRITDGTHLTPKFISSGVPFIFVKNFQNGRINFKTDKFISEEEHEALYKRCPVEQGDVLYTTVGATYGKAVAVGKFTKFAFQRHVAHLKPDKEKILPEFLESMMQLPFVKQQADRWARGAAQPTINLTELRQFEIPLPILSSQREYVSRIAIVNKLKTVHEESDEELGNLFESLQHRAFWGKL